MATLQSSIQLRDAMTPVFRNLVGVVTSVVNGFEEMNAASSNAIDTGAVNEAYRGLAEVNTQLDQMESNIHQSVQPAVNVGAEFASWQKAIIVANQALSMVKGTLGQMGVFDLSGAFDRIDTMNQFNRTITQMSGSADMAKASLEQLKETTKGTAYGLDVAAKSAQGLYTRGMSLGASTNQVRVWADAVAFYGKGTSDQLETAMDAIGKMYTKGTVEMGQLNRLFDIGLAPVEIYADAVGRSAAQIQEELSNGTIAALDFINTVSQAMDAGVSSGAAKEAGATWKATFANTAAAINRGWISVIESLDNALVNNGLSSSMEMIQMFGNAVEEVLNNVAGAMEYIIPVFVQIADFGRMIADNWSIIAPIVYGVVSVFLLYTAVKAAMNAVTVISNTLTAIQNGLQTVAAAKAAMATGATFAQTAAQHGLNAALLACPLTWIILIIIAIIAIIYAVVAAINKVTGSTISATGIIVGALAVAAAFIGNLFVTVINFVIDIFVVLWNFIAAFANFFANVFNDPIGAIARLFFDLVDVVLSLLQALASAIDTIFGSNLAGSVQGWRDNLSGWVDDTFGKGTEVMAKLNAEDMHLGRFEYGSAWDAGYNWGAGLESDIGDFFDTGKYETLADSNPYDYTAEYDNQDMGNDLGGTAANTGNTAANTARMADSMDSSAEELKWIREIAERQAINKFTTAQVTVDMTGMSNQISSDVDIDGFFNAFEERLEESILISQEKVSV